MADDHPSKRFKEDPDPDDEEGWEQDHENDGDDNKPSDSASSSSQKKSFDPLSILKKYGFKEGQGVGKDAQGIVEPIKESSHFGRLGLGFEAQGLSDADLGRYVPEEISTVESVLWYDNPDPTAIPTSQDMASWMNVGRRKRTIDDETCFCDAELLADMLAAKTILDNVDEKTYLPARTRSNPFELIKKEFFQNRAALKMANIDAVFDYMFTSPKTLEKNAPLYFADVCAGPGGFTEYVMWRKKWRAKGFGFTLKGSHDFDLVKFNRDSPYETFHTYYGPDGNGDVYSTSNLRGFVELIKRQTNGEMLHFVMADGGFDVTSNENIQEILNKQLLLGQFLCALSVLRKGGHFTCKMFDVFTPFSVGLLHILSRHFRRICIFKPNTSRPANSERYVVCEDMLVSNPPVVEYLFQVNDMINKLKIKDVEDVNEVVPRELLEGTFVDYITESNNILALQQIKGLRKVHFFLKDVTIPPDDQQRIRRECLERWRIPNHGPLRYENIYDPEQYFETVVCKPSATPAHPSLREFSSSDLSDTSRLRSLRDWVVVPASSHGRLCYVAAPSRARVLARPLSADRWEEWAGLVLPEGTFLLAETCSETDKDRRKFEAVHIVDVIMLGKEDVRRLPYEERMGLADLMTHNMARDSSASYGNVHRASRPFRLRSKPIFSLKHLSDLVQLVSPTNVFSPAENVTCSFHGVYLAPVLTLTALDSKKWTKHYDEDTNSHYFQNNTNHDEIKWEKELVVPLPFKTLLDQRTFWSVSGSIPLSSLLSFVEHHSKPLK